MTSSPQPNIAPTVAPGDKMSDDALRIAADAVAPPIGAVTKEGAIYAGISPDTGKPLYAMPQDAWLQRKAIPWKSAPRMDFNEAMKYAKDLCSLKPFGHNDWRVPTKDELNVLFNNRAAIGGFDLEGSYGGGSWYWSSSTPRDCEWSAHREFFGDHCHDRDTEYKTSKMNVRLVRSEGPKP